MLVSAVLVLLYMTFFQQPEQCKTSQDFLFILIDCLEIFCLHVCQFGCGTMFVSMTRRKVFHGKTREIRKQNQIKLNCICEFCEELLCSVSEKVLY